METIYTYRPIRFFIYIFLCTWIPWFITAYLSDRRGGEMLQLFFLFTGLAAPCIVAIGMIYASKSIALVGNFWKRLFLYKVQSSSLLLIFFVIPAIFFLSTAISLLFGQSAEQFKLASDFQVMKGWHLLSLAIPFFLAPALEELGWRGYGVDSLRSRFNLFYTTLLFAILWGLWHLPLFFIQGYYHYELRHLSVIYVMNFFISLMPAAVLLNWIFYRNSRSILIVILAHSVLNACSILFKTAQFTKCIVTLLLCVVSVIIILKDKDLFFGFSRLKR